MNPFRSFRVLSSAVVFVAVTTPAAAVIPGIVDSHSHMAIEGRINEGTENLTPEVRIKDAIEHDDIGLWHALEGIEFALGENPTRANRPNIPGTPARSPRTRMG